MVNEFNKPAPTDNHDTNNNILHERLAASNQQLREMQEEHRQLLEEMERLRIRATELTMLNELHQHRPRAPQNESRVTVQDTTPPETTEPKSPVETLNEPVQDTTDNPENNDSDYIQQKLAEIAALKSQYKRVQHMINTTNLIEQHLASKQEVGKSETDTPSEPRSVPLLNSTSVENVASVSTLNCNDTTEASTTAQNTATGNPQQAKQELLGAMCEMFTDFSNNLREEAESLRAERERIRALKEEILQRRKEKK